MGQSKCHPCKSQKIDDLMDALSHPLRRGVIYYFENITSDESATLEDLASHIAQCVSEKNRESAALHLAHTHIPKLESHGWVDYDPRTQQVRYRGHDSAEELLSELADMTR